MSAHGGAEQFVPNGFAKHVFEKEFSIGVPRERLWDLLNDRKTFTRGQLFPFRVEFVDASGSREAGFVPGTQTVHHGPGLCFAGVIGEVRRPEYRDLSYYYGSYVLSLRLLRPTRLEFFFAAPTVGRSVVRLRVSSLVREPFGGLWTAVQHLFWSQFGWNIRILLAISPGRKR